MGFKWIPLLFIVYLIVPNYAFKESRFRRSIDISAAHSLISDGKLSKEITPNNYNLDIRTNFEDFTFTGFIKINVTWQEETNKIELHVHNDLQVSHSDVKVTQIALDDTVRSSTPTPPIPLAIESTERLPKKPIYVIYLTKYLKRGSQCEIEMSFNGTIYESTEGLFRGNYLDENGDKKVYFATHLRPNNARRLFPCFDEPSYKVPFTVSISRPKNFTTLFNTPHIMEEDDLDSNYVIDYFETTPPMSTFTLGFVISELVEVNYTHLKKITRPTIRIWAREEIHDGLTEIYNKTVKILETLKNYWGVDYPLQKLDLVALPSFTTVESADNWGLIVFKESEITNRGYYMLAQEIIYQWLGSWATPYWWSDAHVNKAMVGFLSSVTSLEIDERDVAYENKWQMTVLYAMYYEYSKRYPHSRITAMKQETTCRKTELVLRMLNYTLGGETFKRGLQKFLMDREYKTFFGDDVWDALTKQAHEDKVLEEKVTVNEIAGTWITKDRLPVVKITRNYEKRTAIAEQRVYLRERPHDVPEQDKMLWWIPLVVVFQENLDFSNSKPFKWIKKARNTELTDLPKADQFIIVNPEEIGPFPVNYDVKNWNLLAKYLQTKEGRTKIPIYTRAKLLHDAWNLAYAGDLSFSTALNMTLFMKYEREHLVWTPLFTMIDHIGRHICMSDVYKKFEIYVRMLLTPVYEELGPIKLPGEETWKENLRSSAKTFLCRAGYRPCIEEAQDEYKLWMDSDAENPISNTYICPVFKWGTMDEWEFGLERVINFPTTRKPSERTYLLKTLAGCPLNRLKIERLLNITILEQNGNFTDNDIFLIFSMLTSNSQGYTTLFNFLQNNWDIIRQRFENKTNLWDSLISTSTGVFTTQVGYDMVSQLYVQRHGEFGSAEHIIEKSLKNIKEETKWSNENLPVIEKWLDDYLATINIKDSKFMG